MADGRKQRIPRHPTMPLPNELLMIIREQSTMPAQCEWPNS